MPQLMFAALILYLHATVFSKKESFKQQLFGSTLGTALCFSPIRPSLSACRSCITAMSGLCPPVPTELVSVFYLKTGSVQQEQECSSQTIKDLSPGSSLQRPWNTREGSQAEIQCVLFPTYRRVLEGVNLGVLALMKVKCEGSKLSLNPEV